MKKTEKKRLNQLLHDLFKQEDLNSCNKPIYSLRLDGETVVKKRRMFSKIFKLDENNQYGFAMAKPFPIGIFKKEPSVTMDVFNKSIDNFDPNAEICEIFVVDIEFDAYDDPRKKYMMRYFSVSLSQRAKFLWTDVVFIRYSPAWGLEKGKTY